MTRINTHLPQRLAHVIDVLEDTLSIGVALTAYHHRIVLIDAEAAERETRQIDPSQLRPGQVSFSSCILGVCLVKSSGRFGDCKLQGSRIVTHSRGNSQFPPLSACKIQGSQP